MDFFPMFCNLQGKNCLLVGGGEVAERKAKMLLKAQAKLSVCALTFTPQLLQWQQANLVELIQSNFSAELLDTKWLVIAATNDPQLNQHISELAQQRQIFCNVVDAPTNTGFIMPAIIDRSPLMVAISTGGKAPLLARLFRTKLEALIPQRIGQLINLADSLRHRVKQRFNGLAARKHFWESLFNYQNIFLQPTTPAQFIHSAEQLLQQDKQPIGEVILVGAGPGAADLLTLKALQVLQTADVVVYDNLVSQEILDLARRDARYIFGGKQHKGKSSAQQQINQILLDYAKQGLKVVRLKGGDPFVFGRGGEEIAYLTAHGIATSVVPGITAALGCAANVKVPLSHRDYAHGVRLITGHLAADDAYNWANMVQTAETLVFYMGLNKAASIQSNLIKHGMDFNTPTMIIENGTTQRQKVFTAPLAKLAKIARQANSPSLIIVGKVVSLYRGDSSQRPIDSSSFVAGLSQPVMSQEKVV